MLLYVWPLLNPLSIYATFTAIVPGAYHAGEAKMCKNVLKWRTFELTDWITGKRLKIDEYMLRCVWQALNPLFIHVNLTRLSQGRTQWRPKYVSGWLHKLTHVPLAIAILLVYIWQSLLHYKRACRATTIPATWCRAVRRRSNLLSCIVGPIFGTISPQMPVTW